MPTSEEFLDNPLTSTLQGMDATLAQLGSSYTLATDNAIKLMLMTACHESGGFKYDVQLAGGPARSYYQIEPNTLQDLYDNYLAYRPDLKTALDKYKPAGNPPLDQALLDETYATAACRLIYYRMPAAVPAVDDDQALADYWKQYWNTPEGAGTTEQFLSDWQLYKPASMT